MLIAPFVEELIFRGFLLPLIAKSVGPWLAIVLTAILFALPHGAQNEWAWQQLTLIALAGVAFGFVRVRTGANVGVVPDARQLQRHAVSRLPVDAVNFVRARDS